MDMSFAGQALAAEYLAANHASLGNEVHVLPEELDQQIARRRDCGQVGQRLIRGRAGWNQKDHRPRRLNRRQKRRLVWAVDEALAKWACGKRRALLRITVIDRDAKPLLG
jgi:hypothetical protein